MRIPHEGRRVTGLRGKQKTMRRQHILDATLKLLSKKMFSDISLQDIAAQADVTVPTIYNYFGSKSSVILELVLSRQEELSERMEAFISKRSHRDAQRAITDWIKLVTDGAFDTLDRDVWRSLYQERVKDDDLGPLFGKLSSFYVGRSVQFLEMLKQKKLIHAETDSKAAAKLLDSVCEHYFRLSIFYNAQARSGYGDDIRAIVKELCRGLAPAP